MPNQSLESDCETASLFAAAQLQRWAVREIIQLLEIVPRLCYIASINRGE